MESWAVITPLGWRVVYKLPECRNDKSIFLHLNVCSCNSHQNDNLFPFEPVVGVVTNHHLCWRSIY